MTRGVHKDDCGYHALAWALLTDDRPAEADAAMTRSLTLERLS